MLYARFLRRALLLFTLTGSHTAIGDELIGHYMSTAVGAGVSRVTRDDQAGTTFHTLGTFRLMFDLRTEQRFLWGVDLNWLRLYSADKKLLDRQLNGEDAGLVLGFRQRRLTLWARAGGGRMRVEAQGADEPSRRYGYLHLATGLNWAIYTTSYVWLEGLVTLGWIRGEQAWDQSLTPREFMQVSAALAVTLFDF
jgi:hypothetical protein